MIDFLLMGTFAVFLCDGKKKTEVWMIFQKGGHLFFLLFLNVHKSQRRREKEIFFK
jgi:hypothetical protein